METEDAIQELRLKQKQRITLIPLTYTTYNEPCQNKPTMAMFSMSYLVILFNWLGY